MLYEEPEYDPPGTREPELMASGGVEVGTMMSGALREVANVGPGAQDTIPCGDKKAIQTLNTTVPAAMAPTDTSQYEKSLPKNPKSRVENAQNPAFSHTRPSVLSQQMEALEKFSGRYSLVKDLGLGTYAKVKLGHDNYHDTRVAVKIIRKTQIKTKKHRVRINREIKNLKALNHPNIIKIYDVYETESEIIMIMEYVAGGELFDFIVNNKVIPEDTARLYFRQIISAIDYCHGKKIVHRDLKPENLLLSSDATQIKVIDFGFSNHFEYLDFLDTFCGSPFYASPEMVTGQNYVGPEVDIWSMGVILYALLCGCLPFDESSSRSSRLTLKESEASDRNSVAATSIPSNGVQCPSATNSTPTDPLTANQTELCASKGNQPDGEAATHCSDLHSEASSQGRSNLDSSAIENSTTSNTRKSNIKALYSKIASGLYKDPIFLTDGARDLIRKCLTVDPRYRITASELRLHPWVNCGFNVPPLRIPLGKVLNMHDPRTYAPTPEEKFEIDRGYQKPRPCVNGRFINSTGLLQTVHGFGMARQNQEIPRTAPKEASEEEGDGDGTPAHDPCQKVTDQSGLDSGFNMKKGIQPRYFAPTIDCCLKEKKSGFLKTNLCEYLFDDNTVSSLKRDSKHIGKRNDDGPEVGSKRDLDATPQRKSKRYSIQEALRILNLRK